MTEQPPSYPPYPPRRNVGINPWAVASLVCSLFGVCLFIAAFPGVIFGFVALSHIKRTGQGGRGLAMAGIVIGAIVLVVGISLWTLGALHGHTPPKYYGAPSAAEIVALHAV